MSVDDHDKIDVISLESETGRVALTITDHLAWDEFSGEHMLSLQKKFNRYLAFIESGEMLERFPKYTGKPIMIRVIGKYDLSKQAEDFYERAKGVIENAGFELRFFPPKEWDELVKQGKQ